MSVCLTDDAVRPPTEVPLRGSSAGGSVLDEKGVAAQAAGALTGEGWDGESAGPGARGHDAVGRGMCAERDDRRLRCAARSGVVLHAATRPGAALRDATSER